MNRHIMVLSSIIFGILCFFKEGFSEQATSLPSVLAQDMKSDFLQQRLSMQQSTIRAPHTGVLNALCIMIKFSDQTEFPQPRSVYEKKFNDVSGSTASVQHYYKEVSYNKLDVKTSIFPICDQNTNLSFTDINKRNYYLEFHKDTNPDGWKTIAEGRKRDHGLYKRAIEFIASQVPVSLNLDGDNDGFADYLCLIIRGKSGPWGDVGLWPHSGVFDSYTIKINGARLFNFSVQTDGDGNGGSVSAGTLCHELFHVLGSPDLYVYTQSAVTPIGGWDIMASGSMHMSAYMKYKYSNHEWIKQIPLIRKSGTYTLRPLSSDSNNCFRINSPFSKNEYFIVEFRKKSGLYETALPGEGLLIYRVNDHAFGNGFGTPFEAYVFRANGTKTVNGDIKNAFFSSESGRTTFNDSTSNPQCFLSDGSRGGISISKITSASQSTISFDVSMASCEIQSPTSEKVMKKGDQVQITAVSTDAQVEFFIDDSLVSTSSTTPFTYAWNTTNYSLGKHVISIKSTTTDKVIARHQINTYLSDGSPVVMITNPLPQSIVSIGKPVIIQAEVKNLTGVTKQVTLWVNDSTLVTLTNPPYEISWIPTSHWKGNCRIKAVAVDDLGKQSIQQITVVVHEDVLNESFEQQWPPVGWKINSSDYGWYVCDKMPYKGIRSAATRNYHVAGEAILETPVVRVPGSALLEFYWIDRSLDVTYGNSSIQNRYVEKHDTTFCEISSDGGGKWSTVAQLSSQQIQTEYKKIIIDLKPYAGKDISIRWRDVSDESLDAQGTSLDDVRIITDATTMGDPIQFVTQTKIKILSLRLHPVKNYATINFYLPHDVAGQVTGDLYSINGRKIQQIVNSSAIPGMHSANFSTAQLSSGVYFVVLTIDKARSVGPLMFIKK